MAGIPEVANYVGRGWYALLDIASYAKSCTSSSQDKQCSMFSQEQLGRIEIRCRGGASLNLVNLKPLQELDNWGNMKNRA